MSIRDTCPARLKEVRKERQLTQAEAAEMVGCTQCTWAHWELGYGMPQVEILADAADAFGVSVEWLLGRTEVREIREEDR